MTDPTETKTPATEAKDTVPLRRSSARATRQLRIGMIAAPYYFFLEVLVDSGQ